MSNYLDPENYDIRKLHRMDNDTFHVFIDREELINLNDTLWRYFFRKNNHQLEYTYGSLLNHIILERQMINFCCKHVILDFTKQQIVEIKTDARIGGNMR
eukprot:582064_1